MKRSEVRKGRERISFRARSILGVQMDFKRGIIVFLECNIAGNRHNIVFRLSHSVCDVCLKLHISSLH